MEIKICILCSVQHRFQPLQADSLAAEIFRLSSLLQCRMAVEQCAPCLIHALPFPALLPRFLSMSIPLASSTLLLSSTPKQCLQYLFASSPHPTPIWFLGVYSRVWGFFRLFADKTSLRAFPVSLSDGSAAEHFSVCLQIQKLQSK